MAAMAAKTYQQMTRREKLSYLKALSYNAARKVQRSKSDWREFLRFYAKLYKYPFQEALLIYEQAPNATACGEIQHWNKVGRRVQRGTKGIPVVSGSEDMEIRYVFDISDTYGEDRGIPRRWTLPERYMDAVADELASRFTVEPPTDNQSKNLKWAAEEYVRESCGDYLDNLRQNAGSSFLGALDDDNLRTEFTDTVVDSVGYLISERLGLAQGLYNDDELSFQYLYNFNTEAVLCQAGAAVGQISRSVLTLIAQTIQNQQKIERVRQNDERRTVYERGSKGGAVDDRGGNRGNGAPATRAAAPDGQVRQPVSELSPGEPSGAARVPVDGNNAAGRGAGSGQGGADDAGNAATPAPRQDTETGRDEGLHGNGALRDGDPRPGGGNRAERDRVQAEVTELSAETKAEDENPPLSAFQWELRDTNAIYHKYAKVFLERVRQDQPYRDTCKNSDEENSRIECEAAVSRVMDDFGVSDIELYRAFHETEHFRERLLDYVFGASYQTEPRPFRVTDRQLNIFDMAAELKQADSARDALNAVGHNVAVANDEPGTTTRYPTEQPDIPDIMEDIFPDEDDGSIAEIAESAVPTPVPSNLPKPPNFTITPDLDFSGGAKTKYRRNVDAIRLLRVIEAENRYAARSEQHTLALYSGWGGVSQALTPDQPGWEKEHAELKELLSEQEYRAAEGSTLTAYYTPTEVIGGIYAGLERLGFKGGNVLEPSMGVGAFYGCMPEDVAKKSRLYGVELDSVTGRIARQLYPNAHIKVDGFERADLPDSFFDAAIGNVPFGQYKLNDPKFDKYNFLIHDYFFAKALDKVRPGGVLAFVTSKGTLDKANTSVRRYIAERAELLGAIRLPNTAFKANAGTEVTSDIIFLKKRDRAVDAENESWIYTGQTEGGLALNEYFIDTPHMMLGTLGVDSRFGDTTLNPDGRDLREALLEAVSFLPEDVLDGAVSLDELDDAISDKIPADPAVKNYCFTVMADGAIYQRVDSRMERREFAKTAAERVKAMIDMRALTRFMLTQQLEGISDEDLVRQQSELNGQYDKFYKKFGPINSRYNASLFGEDADFPLLSSLENDENGTVTKAAIFSKRTIAPGKKITHVDTAVEALPVCLNERGYVDIGFIASLCGKPYRSVIDDLAGVIFKNPAYDDPDDENNIFAGWETADEYLSGRVRDKLAAAEVAVQDNPLYAANVTALQAVQPVPLEAHEISARIGAHWIDADYYRRFLLEKLNVPAAAQTSVKVYYSQRSGEWAVESAFGLQNAVEATNAYGTKRMDAYYLFETTLNQRNARIYDTVEVDGKDKRVLNHKATIAIRDRQAKIKQEFKRWIFDDPERREKLCEIYNRLFNSERSRAYDGSHLTFPGMSPEVKLDSHQRNGAARILYGGNTLLAHVVGAGKTYTMAVAVMELKRLGLARKPCFVVPNHLVGQWAAAFQKIYPTANILAATKKDFAKQNRRRFCARIATGEWDAVIIGHSSFEKVPMSSERLQVRMERELDEVGAALIEAKMDKGERITIKELERERKSLEYQLKKLQESSKDNLVTFEQLGVDALFTDEAHGYKDL
jgi:N12 class adenine-specific DNA methylase